MRRRVPRALWGDYEAQLTLFTNVLPNGCWEFTGYILPCGYGQLGRNITAHRIAWEVANGRSVPEGLVVDHLCHNADPDCNADNECPHRRCVNPDHLEPVTSAENLRRGKGFGGINSRATHCVQGHELIEDNIYYRPDRFGRLCRTCRYDSGVRAAENHREENMLAARAMRRRDNPLSFAIRAWAIDAGLPCATYGPISKVVRDAYNAAHSSDEAAA